MQTLPRIPFNRPCFQGKELVYIAEAISRGHISGGGSFTKRCEQLLEERLGVDRVLLTTSCTHALEMAAMLLDIKAGDEIIVPSYTFVTTINAFVVQGAKPVFVDIRPDTLNIDESRIEEKITPRTRAIVVVHYAGVGCEMDAIMGIAKKHGLLVIEDNAHGLLGQYRGRKLGTIGSLATLSFHETKNVTCGEGGALVINEPSMMERAEIIREKGTDRSRFFRGQVDKYTWVDIGSSYVLSDLLAAFLLAQLDAIDDIYECRRRVWDFYTLHTADWAKRNQASLPVVPAHCEQAYHMFYVLMPDQLSRHSVIEHMKAQNIQCVFHYLPLHLSPMGQKFGGQPGDCPVAESISERLLRFPFYNELRATEQARIVAALP